MKGPQAPSRFWFRRAILVLALSPLFLADLLAVDFIRGDANYDLTVDISDAVYTLSYLFRGGPDPRCLAAADSNDDEDIDLSDAVKTLTVIFRGGEMIPPPWPNAGPDPTPGLTCGLRPNVAPGVTITSPVQGTVVTGETITVNGRATDDNAVLRVVVAGDDATPAGPPRVPFNFSAQVPLPAGPSLLKVEVVDDYGRATFKDLCVGRTPILRSGESCQGLALDISGGTGYDEIEVILQPFMNQIPGMLDGAIRGALLYQGSVIGVDIRVTGNHVEVGGAIGLDIYPTASNRMGITVTFQEIRLYADGQSDYGWLGTDGWNAVWTARNLTITGAFALSPKAGGGGLDVTSDGFTVNIGSSDLSVNGFLDPFGIFDGIVNFLADLFRGEIEAQVRQAVEQTANDQLLPAIAQAFSNLKLDLDLDTLSLKTLFHDVVESANGLSVLFDANWTGSQQSPDFPPFPGSRAEFAPYPTFPLAVSVPHPVDASICLSADTLNQALFELVAGGILKADVDLSSLSTSPIPVDVGTLASILEPRLTTLPTVSPDDPFAIRVRAQYPVEVRLGEGYLGRPIVGEGAEWTYFKGRSEPSAAWKNLTFDDSAWESGPSGFGYSSDEAELRSVRTELPDMGGLYTSLYARTKFSLSSLTTLGPIILRVLTDDGFVAYLNGREVGRSNVTGTPPLFGATADGVVEPQWVAIDLAPYRSYLRVGENVLAVQGHNQSASSSDFVLVPELIEVTSPPAGTISEIPIEIDVQDLNVAFVADTRADGIGDADGDRIADEVDLFALALSFRIQARLQLFRGEGGVPTIGFSFLQTDGSDPDKFPDGIIGGERGLEVGVAMEAFDTDDARLVEFAQLVWALIGPSLGETLGEFEIPSVPLPELSFDLDEDGTPDVRLEIQEASLVAVDTNGDARPDWIAVLGDLESAAAR